MQLYFMTSFQDPRRVGTASAAAASSATLPHRLKMAYPPNLQQQPHHHRPNVELKHTGGSNCRLHISSNAASNPMVKSGGSSQALASIRTDGTPSISSNSETQFDSPTASTTSQGQPQQPQQPNSNTVRRNLKPKLTTFCSPEAQIMESPLVARKSPQIELSGHGSGPSVNLSSPHETTSILMNK